MSYLNRKNNYLNKRGITVPWMIKPVYKRKFSFAIVIPSYGESNHILQTLSSINKNNILLLKETLVIVVINNSSKTKNTIKNDNKKSHHILKKSKFNFSLGIIDAYTKKFHLPSKHAGVGLARKIGMDLSIKYLKNEKSILFSTDADTIVSNLYIETVFNYFNKENIGAAVVGFQHRSSKHRTIEINIKNYEKFLLSTAEKISKAGSPYGYVSMGSTMICTVDSYISIGGMTRKKATEDFYFLQELAKYCGVHSISEILVFPSARPVSRVYLGTGFRMKQAIEGEKINNLYYSEQAFILLRKWINLGISSWKINIVELIEKTTKINEKLKEFIINEGIEQIWENLQSSSPTERHFIQQFHRWFDNLKTIRLLKIFS